MRINKQKPRDFSAETEINNKQKNVVDFCENKEKKTQVTSSNLFNFCVSHSTTVERVSRGDR